MTYSPHIRREIRKTTNSEVIIQKHARVVNERSEKNPPVRNALEHLTGGFRIQFSLVPYTHAFGSRRETMDVFAHWVTY